MTDETKPDFSSLLALLSSAPYTVTGQWYYKQSVTLDGYNFVRCRFDNCSVITLKGTFSLDHCYFSSCMYYVQKEAKAVVQLASLVVPELRQRWPFVAIRQEADGTFSTTP